MCCCETDYVTEKLLKPLKYYTVPIVYGTANYSRFLPKGAYLNAMELGAKRLAKEMNDIINDKERYYSFFKWHNHYSFHSPDEDPATDNYCRLCAALNHVDTRQTQNNFLDWWNCKKIKKLFSRNCKDVLTCLE
ncbi:alpha-(1,3)-fucosyltransferase C-like isoform X2 [Pectinophora gossypiella]|uniref:alpha-(1,3)-fucosyltransferase C-like isoform X2 n=1 Tax=Pectinophora gossypiella TaxID=13191 RepID=UPI00214EBEAF|nr:alpha-(1,3)-fucosyltransferase C-like isoform X2 [Pectinophora gossypiella]